MTSAIDELLEHLRSEIRVATKAAKYAQLMPSVLRRCQFETGCYARWIAAVEKLQDDYDEEVNQHGWKDR